MPKVTRSKTRAFLFEDKDIIEKLPLIQKLSYTSSTGAVHRKVKNLYLPHLLLLLFHKQEHRQDLSLGGGFNLGSLPP